jgi:hypothetical protein
MECRHRPPPPGVQSGRVGCSHSVRCRAQVAPPSALSNRTPGVPAGVDGPVALAGHDHPDPLERRVPALGEGDALGLVPGAVGVLGPPELGPVERRRHRRPAAGPSAGRARRTRRARPRTRAPARPTARSAPLEREQALLRAHEELRHVLTCLLRSPEGRPPRRPGQRRVPAPLLPVDEDVEVAPQVPALVEHPPAQARLASSSARSPSATVAASTACSSRSPASLRSGPRSRTSAISEP